MDINARTLQNNFAQAEKMGKEDLFYAVVLGGFKKLFGYFEKAREIGENGFQKIYHMGFSYYTFYLDFPSTFQLMSNKRFYKKRMFLNRDVRNSL